VTLVLQVLKVTWVTLGLLVYKVIKAPQALQVTLEPLEHRVIWALPEPQAFKVTLVLQAQPDHKVNKV
jgi:hypothetical protein